MPEKPTTADGYTSEQVRAVRAACLYIATKLGDLMDDVVVVGGLVPSLLIAQEELPEGEEAHVGTMDLDVGLALGILEAERYAALAERLRRTGWSPDVNERGNPTPQRWKIVADMAVTVDFLIPPSSRADRGGDLRHIEPDLAAVITPGLHLAFQDRELVSLSGTTVRGESATRSVWVCGPGAYVVLKALAFAARGENKDAYDLYYVVRNFGTGVEEVAERVASIAADPEAEKALGILRQDFLDVDGLGPRRVAEFLRRGPDEAIQADVAGFIRRLLAAVEPVAG